MTLIHKQATVQSAPNHHSIHTQRQPNQTSPINNFMIVEEVEEEKEGVQAITKTHIEFKIVGTRKTVVINRDIHRLTLCILLPKWAVIVCQATL